MNPLSAQERFLRDEFHRLTLSATVQRAQVYAPGTAEQSRLHFQKGLQRELEVLALRYAEPVADFDHCESIRAIAASLSAQYSLVLRDGRFRIGPAQKALNLFLKYLWCVKQIPTPPHCPFDRVVIGLFPLRDQVNWTTLDSVDGYLQLVSAARRMAGSQSLAEWELDVYGKRSLVAARAT